MDNPIPVDLGRIAQDLQIRRVQVESVVQLLDDGNTVPFITRYRKERTGNLNEVVIREIQLRVQRLRELAERKETILKAIEAQGKLDADLAAAIRAAENPKRLEDLYLPFKPKKRTKASDARERGLEPLALRIWTRDETLTDVVAAAQEFVDAEKGVDTVEKVLEGVGHILSEAISEMATVRDVVRKIVWRTGRIVTSKGEVAEGQGLEYRDYFDYTEPVSQIPPHRVLAINRGDKEGPLKVRLEVARPELEAALFSQLPLEGHPQHDLFHAAAIDALDRLILPSMEREVRRDLTEAAEKHAVEVFARNLGSLLLQPPIPKQAVLAIDPGFKNGCKVAVLDANGQMVDHVVIYPHAPQNRRSEAKLALKDLVGKHHVGVVAIGNGTACRETEELVAEIIAEGTRFSSGGEGAAPPVPAEPAGVEPAPATPAGPEPAPATLAEPNAVLPPAPGEGAGVAEDAAPPATTDHTPTESSPVGPGSAEPYRPADAETSDWPVLHAAPEPESAAAHAEVLASSAAEPEAASHADVPPASAHDESRATLGNGSSSETPAVHDPHAPASESPVEMLPPISGGAPGPDEGESAGAAEGRPAETAAPDASTAVAVESHTAHDAQPPPASAGGEPAADASPVQYPVPDDWQPESEGPEDAGRAEVDTAEPAVHVQPPGEAPGLEAIQDHDEAPSPTGDHLPPPESEAARLPAEGVAATEPAAATCETTEQGAAPVARPVSAPPTGRPPRPGKSGSGRSDSSRSRGGRSRQPSGPPQPPAPPQPHPADPQLAQLAYVIVNEAGASAYSTSQVGRDELPDLDATLRGTISIGRRLQDPLSELVKIEPQNIGVGLYQHDVNPKQLKETLEAVIASCVNFVGVDLNTASVPLLRRVSGLNQLTARRIVDFRKERGRFTGREQLMEVEGVGPATFTQAAGFLKVPDGEQPLDRTWVHPESYPAAIKLLEKFGFGPDVVRDKVRLPELRAQLAQADIPALASELGVGEFTLRDIIEALGRPERDPRDDLPKPIFKKGILKLEDLSAGMELKGTVLNVVDFGAFVDIGLKDSGLVHISQLANRYVKSPHDVVSVGDVVTVWVMGVDQERKRVSLTMVKPGTERHRGPQAGGRRGEPHEPNREREARGPGQGRRGPEGRGPRPPASLLTSPPVGAPSVAVLAESPARRTDRDHARDRDRGAGHGPGPGGPRSADSGTSPGRPASRPPGPGGPRGYGQGPGGGRPGRFDRDRDQGPPPRPAPRPSRPGPPPPPLSKDALAGNVPLRTFGQLKQLWEARVEGPPEEGAGPGDAPAGPQRTENHAGPASESRESDAVPPADSPAPAEAQPEVSGRSE